MQINMITKAINFSQDMGCLQINACCLHLFGTSALFGILLMFLLIMTFTGNLYLFRGPNLILNQTSDITKTICIVKNKYVLALIHNYNVLKSHQQYLRFQKHIRRSTTFEIKINWSMKRNFAVIYFISP